MGKVFFPNFGLLNKPKQKVYGNIEESFHDIQSFINVVKNQQNFEVAFIFRVYLEQNVFMDSCGGGGLIIENNKLKYMTKILNNGCNVTPR